MCVFVDIIIIFCLYILLCSIMEPNPFLGFGDTMRLWGIYLMGAVFINIWVVLARTVFCTFCMLMFSWCIYHCVLDQIESTCYHATFFQFLFKDLYSKRVFLSFLGRCFFFFYFFLTFGQAYRWRDKLFPIISALLGLISSSLWIGMPKWIVDTSFSVTVDDSCSIYSLLILKL